MEELTLEEKIGQLFMVGLEEKKEAQISKLIKENKIGGVVLYKKNYHTYQEMLQLINNLKKMNKNNKVPLMISIDQEGGRVNRMPPEIANLKSAAKIASTKNEEILQESGEILGAMLKQSGISMNYAPVLDICRFEEKHAIGDRAYAKTKEEVSKYALIVMKEMQKQGIIPVVKHFPGHGLTKKDSHFQIPKITAKIEQLEQEDMLPFEKAIQEGAEAVMVGHLILKDVDKKYPASLSKKVIQKYLIEKYQYKGLIITDDLKMLAIQLHYNLKRSVYKAIEAGNDIVMVGLSYNKIKRMIKYIVKEVKKGKISIDRINTSVEKILKMKEKYKITDELAKGMNIEQMNGRITKLNEQIRK